ncbi:hypothetical protein VP01_847g3 [Puccinia sorghi]|uniref:Uncharacterized protein n=1 Tax=Puccinia sorghi TaxID=27349 RepID=A0A0L6UBC4_9BASI|nr:hypothetical protein VP01_847g3 [Puccinia sorghi]
MALAWQVPKIVPWCSREVLQLRRNYGEITQPTRIREPAQEWLKSWQVQNTQNKTQKLQAQHIRSRLPKTPPLPRIFHKPCNLGYFYLLPLQNMPCIISDPLLLFPWLPLSHTHSSDLLPFVQILLLLGTDHKSHKTNKLALKYSPVTSLVIFFQSKYWMNQMRRKEIRAKRLVFLFEKAQQKRVKEPMVILLVFRLSKAHRLQCLLKGSGIKRKEEISIIFTLCLKPGNLLKFCSYNQLLSFHVSTHLQPVVGLAVLFPVFSVWLIFRFSNRTAILTFLKLVKNPQNQRLSVQTPFYLHQEWKLAGNQRCGNPMGPGTGGRGRVVGWELREFLYLSIRLLDHKKRRGKIRESSLKNTKRHNIHGLFPGCKVFRSETKGYLTHWRRTLSYLLRQFFFPQSPRWLRNLEFNLHQCICLEIWCRMVCRSPRKCPRVAEIVQRMFFEGATHPGVVRTPGWVALSIRVGRMSKTLFLMWLTCFFFFHVSKINFLNVTIVHTATFLYVSVADTATMLHASVAETSIRPKTKATCTHCLHFGSGDLSCCRLAKLLHLLHSG